MGLRSPTHEACSGERVPTDAWPNFWIWSSRFYTTWFHLLFFWWTSGSRNTKLLIISELSFTIPSPGPGSSLSPYPHQALYRFLRLFVVLFIPEHGTVICLRMLSTTHGAWNIVSPKNECIGSLYLASPPCYPTLPPISYTYETTSRL